jgi:hypothetical protein
MVFAMAATIGAGTFSTLAKWHFQAQVRNTLLDYQPKTSFYRLMVEDIPAWSCTAALACVGGWSIWRSVRLRDPLYLLNLPVLFVAWWVMVFVVAGNSFEAFN